METVRDISKKVVQEYKKSLTTKVLLVDGLIAFSLTTALIQFVYMLMVGTFPFNSFLSGFLCCIALFSLAVSLRFQITSSEFKSIISSEKAYGDFSFCCLVLFFVVVSFMG